MWDAQQRERLAFEESILRKYMSNFQFYNRAGDTFIEGWMTTNAGKSYKIRVQLPPNYPFEEPDVYIVSPRTLWKYRHQGTINDAGLSHGFHTAPSCNGYVRICHTKYWSASDTCLRVLIKVALWLEAYEGHRRTGRRIADYLTG